MAYGMVKMLKDTADVYERAAMMRNVVIVGGGGGIAGIAQRILHEMRHVCDRFADMRAMRPVVDGVSIKDASVVATLVPWTGARIMCNARTDPQPLRCLPLALCSMKSSQQ